MYENTQRIMGFLGADADHRTTSNGRSYTVLSLATKSSYRDKQTGEYISRTEWHRAIAWGKLGEWAQPLKKGMHLQIEGEPRSREYADKNHSDVKHRVWEIRAQSILKLDRAEHAKMLPTLQNPTKCPLKGTSLPGRRHA